MNKMGERQPGELSKSFIYYNTKPIINILFTQREHDSPKTNQTHEFNKMFAFKITCILVH